MRGSTSLANYEYDAWLAKNKKAKELLHRKAERRDALKKDLTGHSFSIDPNGPVKVNGLDDFRQKLTERGLALYNEAKKDPNWRIEDNARREQERRGY